MRIHLFRHGSFYVKEGEMAGNIQYKQMKVGKLDIHYFTGGHGEPLLVIHGGGDGARSWLETIAHLTEHYRIYVPDLPGFGRSQSVGNGHDIPEFVEFVEELSTSLGLKRFHLMGHSIGGGIALRYALRFPHKIKKLVLVSSIYLGKEIAPWVRILSSPIFYKGFGIPAHIILEAVKWLVNLFYSPLEFMNPLPRAKVEMAKCILTLKEQATALMNRFSELMIPTLLVWGAKDGIVPVSHAYIAAELIPNCQLKVFEDCGHNVYKQKGSEFSRLLTGFLG